MIHISAIHKLLHEYEGTDRQFDIEYVSKSSGRVVAGTIVCTSSNFERRTMNVKFVQSGEIRTLRTILLIRFNGIPVLI